MEFAILFSVALPSTNSNNLSFSPLAPVDISTTQEKEDIFCLGISQRTRLTGFPRQLDMSVQTGSEDAETIFSTCIDPLQISFLRYLNVDGNVTVNRSFEGHPRVSLSFVICTKDLKNTRLNLLNGTRVNLLGLPLRISSFSVTSLHSDNTQSRIDIQLQGIYAAYGEPSRNPLDCPIRLKNCLKPEAFRSLSSLAFQTGIRILGQDIKIRVPRNTSRDTTTTIRSEFSKRIRVNNAFAYYSNPLGVQAKTWRQSPLHVLNPDKVINIESHNFNGAGSLIDCVQLVKEYRNTELQLDSREATERQNEDNDTTTRWEFENALSFWDCQTPAEPYSVGENVYITKMPSRDILRNPGIAWDVGGFTKTAHKIEERNGVEKRRTSRTYGYVCSSLDNYLVGELGSYRDAVEKGEKYEIAFVPRRFITSYWREVQTTITTRYYDGDGYLIKIETTGKRLARLKQDSSNLDGIRTVFGAKEELFAAEERLAEIQGLEGTEEEVEKLLAIIEKSNALIRLAEYYKFDRTLPVRKVTTYKLASLRSYFSDIKKPDSEGKCIDGSTWVEPKFAKHTLTVEQTRIIEDNPGSTDDFPLPPIETGKIFSEEQKVTITSTKKPERFVTTRFTTNRQGEGLSQKIKVLGSTEHIRRPSIHQRINNNASGGSSGSLFDLNGLQRILINKFLLNTPNSNPKEIISENSISFPDVADLNIALAAAKTQLEIDNAKNAEVLTISTLYHPEYNEGDRVLWEGKEYLIISISHNIKIQPDHLSTNSYQLTLGRILDIPVELTQVRSTLSLGVLAGKNYGLNAIDGNVEYLKNAYNFLSADTIENAQQLGHLDNLASLFGFGLEGTGDFEGGGGIDDFLGGGGLDGSSGLGGQEFLTPIEKGEAYVELLNRLALLQEFKDKFLANLNGFGFGGGVNGDFGDNIAGGGGGDDNLGGAGGSGSNSDDRTSKYYKIEGGKDRGLAELLSQLINLLKDLIKLFRNPSINIGGFGLGSGAGGGAGGSIGGASGGSGEEQEQEEISDDDFLAALLASFGDPDAMFAEIMALIARLIALANSFDPELLINFLNGLGDGSGGSGSGGSNGSGGGNGSGDTGFGTGFGTSEQGEETVEEVLLQLPDYLGFNDLDFATIFNRLDELLRILDLNANKFDFDLDLESLTDYSQGSPVGGSSSVGGGSSFNNGLSGSSSGINSGLSFGGSSSLGSGGLSPSSNGGLSSSGNGGQGGSTIIGSNVNNPSNPGEYGYSDGGQGGSGSGFGDSEASPGTEIYDPIVKLQLPEIEVNYADGLIPFTIGANNLQFPASVIQANNSGGLVSIAVNQFYVDLPEWFNKVESFRSDIGIGVAGTIIHSNASAFSLLLQANYTEIGVAQPGTIIYSSFSNSAAVLLANYSELGSAQPGTIIYTNFTSSTTLIQTASSSVGIPSNAIATYPPS